MDFTIKSEAFPEDTTRSRNNVVVPRVRHVGPNLQNKILSHAPASLISVDFASHDGDDELDDSSRYEDFASSGRKNPANFRNQGDAFQFNGMGQGSGGAMHQDLCSGFQEQPSLPPKIPQDSVKTDFDGGSQHHPHHISSTAPPSDDDSSPGVENEGSIGSPAPDKGSLARHVKAEAPDDFQTDKTRFPHGDSYDDIPIKKRKHSPGLESQKQLHDIQLSDAPSHHPTKHNGYSSSHNLTREHNTPYANAQKDLDYEPQVLANMSYQQLADEPFDTSPHHIDLNDPALTSDSSLSDRLRYLHSLGGPKESVQLQRQAFFSSLPIAHYEECGDLMADQFSQIITKFKEARQQKRRLAREFEDEVSAREKVVESRKAAVMNDLSRLKRAGQDVVRR
ncbi:MAG: hypothetical protein L6R41_002813 [Letrouitia leprolyta]|nr:MAG: hypothetical protein L6R41_002813 [Letrouitia leprolyta]